MPNQAKRPASPPRGARSLPLGSGRDTVMAVHDSAVVQGSGGAPWRRDVRRWAVPAIGTVLSDAGFPHSAEDRR